MVSQKVKIINRTGLHMKLAHTFVSTMSKYDSNVDLVVGDKRINGKSIMNVLGACLECGTEVLIECSGSDEVEMLEQATNLLGSDFNEWE